jgi:hypothetical protein
LPAKNDDAVQQMHRSARFAGKPGSYSAKNDDAVQQVHRGARFAGKSDRRTAGLYEGKVGAP